MVSRKDTVSVGEIVHPGLNDNSIEEPSKLKGFRDYIRFDNCIELFSNDLIHSISTYRRIIL